MTEESDEGDRRSRRSIMKYMASLIFGWLLGTFLDPLRRIVNEAISDTPLGRKAKIGFGYAESQRIDGKGYQVQIVNSGREAAENLSLHLGFEEQITDAIVEEWVNAPPTPETKIEITEGGVARIDIDFVRREISEHYKPIQIHFPVEEGTKSDFASRIDDDEVMFVAYRYSWSFLGERYHESTDHHITRKD